MLKLTTDSEISKLAWYAYQDAPSSIRLLASARTYICPMQPLLREVPPDSSLFDIGCGSGLFLSLLVASGQLTKAVGSDPNSKALNCAKGATERIANEPNISIDFVQSTTPQTWPDGSFSVVSMIDVMHHIPPQQQQAFFEEAVQKVSTGGRLLYKDMCKRPFWKATANRLHDLVLARQWIHYVPISTIKKWGANCGLQLENEMYYSRFVYGHEMLVFKKS